MYIKSKKNKMSKRSYFEPIMRHYVNLICIAKLRNLRRQINFMRKLSILLTFILVLVSITVLAQDKTDSAVENGQ